MTPNSSKKEFEKRIKQLDIPLANLTPAQDIKLMLDFYRDVRADGCEFTNDADMLLFQWGISSYQGRSFNLDITRQFILEEPENEDDEYTMSQLSLSFFFAPTEQTDRIKDSNQWCRTPDELADFETFIIGNDSYRAVAEVRPFKVVLEFSGV